MVVFLLLFIAENTELRKHLKAQIAQSSELENITSSLRDSAKIFEEKAKALKNGYGLV